MTDNIQPLPLHLSEAEISAAWAEAPDPILSNIAEADALRYGLTIMSHGFTYSGTLINHQTFREDAASDLKQAHADSGDTGLDSDIFGKLIDFHFFLPDEEGEFDGENAMPRKFVHLENVTILGGGLPPKGINLPQVRIRISEVSAWTPGAIS